MLQLFTTPKGNSAVYFNHQQITIADPSPKETLKAKVIAERLSAATGVEIQVIALKEQPLSWDTAVKLNG
jgi:hypothetical protein